MTYQLLSAVLHEKAADGTYQLITPLSTSLSTWYVLHEYLDETALNEAQAQLDYYLYLSLLDPSRPNYALYQTENGYVLLSDDEDRELGINLRSFLNCLGSQATSLVLSLIQSEVFELEDFFYGSSRNGSYTSGSVGQSWFESEMSEGDDALNFDKYDIFLRFLLLPVEMTEKVFNFENRHYYPSMRLLSESKQFNDYLAGKNSAIEVAFLTHRLHSATELLSNNQVSIRSHLLDNIFHITNKHKKHTDFFALIKCFQKYSTSCVAQYNEDFKQYFTQLEEALISNSDNPLFISNLAHHFEDYNNPLFNLESVLVVITKRIKKLTLSTQERVQKAISTLLISESPESFLEELGLEGGLKKGRHNTLSALSLYRDQLILEQGYSSKPRIISLSHLLAYEHSQALKPSVSFLRDTTHESEFSLLNNPLIGAICRLPVANPEKAGRHPFSQKMFKDLSYFLMIKVYLSNLKGKRVLYSPNDKELLSLDSNLMNFQTYSSLTEQQQNHLILLYTSVSKEHFRTGVKRAGLRAKMKLLVNENDKGMVQFLGTVNEQVLKEQSNHDELHQYEVILDKASLIINGESYKVLLDKLDAIHKCATTEPLLREACALYADLYKILPFKRDKLGIKESKEEGGAQYTFYQKRLSPVLSAFNQRAASTACFFSIDSPKSVGSPLPSLTSSAASTISI